MKSHTLTHSYLPLLIATTCFVLCAKPVFSADAPSAVAAHDLAAPAAHNPCYDQKDLWPEDVQKTAYVKETWAAAPLFVWTATGKNGQETDPQDPANWTVDGKPATTIPGEGDDVTFPTGSSVRLRENTSLTMRHLTVGKAVTVVKPLLLKPRGNVWIKEAGSVEEMGNFIGPKNVFLRNDNRSFHSPKSAIANKVVFNKPVGSSIEIIGTVQAWDEMGFFCGTVVIGPDASLCPGNRSTQPIYPDATLVMMSGSSFHKRGNQPYEHDTVVSGILMAGTPERSLTRDCTIGLSWKAKGEKGLVETAGHPDDVGMIVNPKGRLLVHSADPEKARLVITWCGLSSSQHQNPDAPDPVDRLVDLVLQGEVSLAGVCFDRIRTGGIRIANQSIQTKGVLSFGEHNQAKPDELFKLLDKPIEAKLVYSAASIPKPASQGGGKDSDLRENK